MIDFLKFSAEALLLTAVIEVAIGWFFGLRTGTDLILIMLINVVTNPLLNYLMLVNGNLHLIPQSQLLLLVLEVSVVLAEWRLLVYAFRQNNKKMLILSVAMNGTSYLAGLVAFR